MSGKNDQTVAHQAADMVDNVADGIRSAAHSAGDSVRNAAQTVRQAAGRAIDAAEESYDEAGQFVRQSANQARARMRACENNFEGYVRDNPKTSLFLAAALGAVIAGVWKRR